MAPLRELVMLCLLAVPTTTFLAPTAITFSPSSISGLSGRSPFYPPRTTSLFSTDQGVEAPNQEVMEELLALPNNLLKEMLAEKGLSKTGNKTTLAERLAVAMQLEVRREELLDEEAERLAKEKKKLSIRQRLAKPLKTDVQQGQYFNALKKLLPENTRMVGFTQRTTDFLSKMGFEKLTDVQQIALPLLLSPTMKEEFYHPTLIHAQTGSGKTLTYLIPIAEALNRLPTDSQPHGISLVVTPTLELARQVAGVARQMCPPDSVQLVHPPCNFAIKRQAGASLFIGSEIDVFTALFGNDALPASPTPKPFAQKFLATCEILVMDEVDSLLLPKKTHKRRDWKQNLDGLAYGAGTGGWWRGEKMSGVIAKKVWSGSKGRARIWGCSATVGRPLRRQFSRVLGLDYFNPTILRVDPKKEGSEDEEEDFIPPFFDSDGLNVVDLETEIGDSGEAEFVPDNVSLDEDFGEVLTTSNKRLVTVPSKVTHHYITVAGEKPPTGGALLANSAGIIGKLGKEGKRTLVVLTHNVGMEVRDSVGAIRHLGGDGAVDLEDYISFQEEKDGIIDEILQGHPGNVGDTGSYTLVCKERSIRGLDLELDAIVVVGRPVGPDEYVHIAGRTGRAGKEGDVYNVLGEQDVGKLKNWSSMLAIKFNDATGF